MYKNGQAYMEHSIVQMTLRRLQIATNVNIVGEYTVSNGNVLAMSVLSCMCGYLCMHPFYRTMVEQVEIIHPVLPRFHGQDPQLDVKQCYQMQ